MRVNALSLVNFRSHRRLTLELGPLTIVGGPNAAGKSSIRMALELALTGRCEVTDRAGRGAGLLVRRGEEEAVVTLVVTPPGGGDDLVVRRTITPSGQTLSVEGRRGKTKDQQAWLMEVLGARPELVSAVCRAADFADLSPAEQQELIRRVVRATATRLEVLGALEQAGAPERAVVTMNPPLEVDLPWLDRAYEEAFERRRALKKRMNALRAEIEAAERRVGRRPRPEEIEKLKQEREALRSRRAELMQRISELKAARCDYELAQRLRRQEGELEEEIRRLEAFECAPGVGLSMLSDVWKMRDAQEAEVEAGLEAFREHLARITELSRWLDALDGVEGPGSCPLSPEITCPLSPEARDQLRAAWQKELAEERQQAEQTDCATSQLQERLHELELWLRQLSDAQAELDDRRRELERVRRSLAELGEAREPDQDEEELERELRHLDEQIYEAERALATAEAAQQADAAVEELLEELRMAGEELQAAEAKIAAFGPSSPLRAHLVARSIEPFLSRASANLATIAPGYQVELVEEEGGPVRVVVDSPQGKLELRHLSTSERLRVGIALTEALAYSAHLGLCVIDGPEILDEAGRGRLSRWLLDLARSGDHTTVLVLTTTERERLRPVEGGLVWWLQGGVAEEVKPEREEMIQL